LVHRIDLMKSHFVTFQNTATMLAAGALTLASVSCVPPAKPETPSQQQIAKIESKPKKIPSTHVSTGEYSTISLEELFLLQQSNGALIYDVRPAYFYNIDHIPGSVNWPHTDYAAQVESRDLEIQKALKDGKKIVVYCFNLGCPEAIDAWRTASLPLE
jgi:hypothetical protein